MYMCNMSRICMCCSDESMRSLETVVALLLGCAVQCDNKVLYIEQIMSLPVRVQEEIAQWIRRVSMRTIVPDNTAVIAQYNIHEW